MKVVASITQVSNSITIATDMHQFEEMHRFSILEYNTVSTVGSSYLKQISSRPFDCHPPSDPH